MDLINSSPAATDDTPPLSEEQVIRNLRQESDLSDQYYAAWWLGRMRSRHPQTVPLLLKTLTALEDHPLDQDRRGVALNAIRSLGWLQDTSTSHILSNLLQSNDYGIREAAARSLGSMQASNAVEGLCALLASGPGIAGQERSHSAFLQEPCEAILEALGSIGSKGSEVVTVIRPFCDHPRALIRSAACRAMLQLTQDGRWAQQLEQLLNDPTPLVRRGALLDLGATGWLPSLPAIQATAAENSLKLVALRGLAEQSGDSNVLDAMDSLL
ncbi:MAG: HEAT repeat domain-containing protein [Synechococcus sp. cluster2_bin.235]|nr:HEAT repeat domain-containing protein [Synechococcus sp. cluster2_bin.235]